jgi:tripartite-type tricarboxylate transporter receptor subunit TctC
MAQVMAGQHAYMFLAVPSALAGLQSGRLRALAVAADRRVAALPDVPTMAEQGYTDLVARDWQGLAVRKGTPREVVARLLAALEAARRDPKVVETLTTTGADVGQAGPEQFGQFVGSEVERWAAIVRDAGIKAE